MGIREKIEKLKLDLNCPSFRPVDIEHAKTVNEVIGEVLSIIDKELGELVAEGEYGLTGELRWTTVLIDNAALYNQLAIKGVEPGDRIAIYVIREE